MDDIKHAANSLNDRGRELDFEVSVHDDECYEDGAISPEVREKLMGKPKQPPPTGICSCFTLAYYQPYFDVDTRDVQERIARALLPFKKNPHFTEAIAKSPDAYGPFWLTTTLIFVIAICSNVAGYLDYEEDVATWDYDFSRLVTAYTLTGIFFLGMPLAIWAVGRSIGANLSLIYLVCLYGYSTTIFIPAAILCIIPDDGSDWVVVLVAMAWSLVFVLCNIWKSIRERTSNEALLPLFACISLAHLVWTMIFKLVFF